MEFGYRRSRLTNSDYIVLSAELELKKGNYDEIKAYMADLTNRRTTKQPLNLPSAGSVFRNPENMYAGELIEKCNLKGYNINGAEVSTKHANFIVNVGGATGKDIIALINTIKGEVQKEYHVELKLEQIIIE